MYVCMYVCMYTLDWVTASPKKKNNKACWSSCASRASSVSFVVHGADRNDDDDDGGDDGDDGDDGGDFDSWVVTLNHCCLALLLLITIYNV